MDGSWYGASYVTPDGVAYAGTTQSFGAGAAIVDADDTFELVNSGGSQYVWEPGQGVVSTAAPITGAALWEGTLWRSAGVGRIQAFKLPERLTSMPLTRTVDTGASCAPTEVQVAQHWLYWSCGTAGPAGVYDLTTNASFGVPAGPVLLGDGYLVRHDAASGDLRLTDVHTDAVGADTTLATFAARGSGDDRHLTWTVDRTSGDVAYADADHVVHVLTTGVPSSPETAVSAQYMDTLEAGGNQYPWTVGGVLSRPAASWRFVVERTSTGEQVHVATGGPTPAAFSTAWSGLTDAGKKPYSGAYTWQIWATPADAPDAPAQLAATGSVVLLDGRAPFHSLSDNGQPEVIGILRGDMMGYTAGEGLVYDGNGHGGLSGQGGYFSLTDLTGVNQSNAVVLFGDLNGDGINDTLVRTVTGALRVYPGLAGYPNPLAGKPVTLGTGWNIYNQLVSVGDLNGDGRDDLVARDGAGVLWFYAANGKGSFVPRVRIGSGWNVYTRIVGMGDLNGDGAGDLLAVDAHGSLWRYLGNGHGSFAPRVQIGSGFSIYNAIVGVGDLTGDGRNDYVARDSAGLLWRYDGDGKGRFSARTRIGTGWNIFSTVL
ncbi:FG-GAP repeat domain-containing protein [Streptacidiphilus rugosus]|uniref:FG-GAP repeat domain-containing protein n=1 Tax=Streptacidiphilus rugosus TaxID=405783 RepID=UPI0018DC22EB|nr:VCBS repeat-containing protein [Streptacidiphilus rugosus]